jgi:signal transduction histidine kinase
MNKNPINILLIEDSDDDATIVNRYLRRSSLFTAKVDRVQSVVDAKAQFSRKSYDVILSDLHLPDSGGIATIACLKALGDSTPLIALTGLDDQEVGIATIQSGANDYLVKNDLTESALSRTIVYSIERFQLRQKLVEANRQLESKNQRLAKMYDMAQQFVDNVSHELRTPLTVIREFASIVHDGIDGPVTNRQKIRLSTLLNRTDDLANMVDDLLDTSRLESGLLRTCRRSHQLRPIIDRAVETLQSRIEAKRIKLTVDTGPREILAFCDAEKLSRILINLLSNSIKFTPVGNSISIVLRDDGGDKIRITVDDTGPGIPASKLEKIFGRFQQVGAHQRVTNCKGVGLGLSIAKALTELNLGSLEVTSTEGVGSKFSVLIPKSNWGAVLNCYIDQREANISENRSVSFFRVRSSAPESQVDPAQADAIDEFLRSTVKTYDLVLQSNECEWLVFACASGPNLRTFKRRMLDEWDELRSDHYGSSLPTISFDHDTTFALGTNRDFLVELVGWEMANSATRACGPAPVTQLHLNTGTKSQL